MTLAPSLLLSDTELEWRVLTPGTRLAVLRRLPGGGSIVRIQGDPGSTFPDHTHFGGEEVYLLRGDYSDPSGTYVAGQYISYPPGSRHTPWTEHGVDMLVIAWAGKPES